MRKYLSLLLLGLALPCLSEARLGKTLEECEALYGPSLGGEDGVHVFMKEKFVYVCEFDPDSGLCDSVLAGTEVKLPLTSTEVAGFLSENPGEGEWTQAEGDEKRWTHSSGDWKAYYGNSGTLLINAAD